MALRPPADADEDQNSSSSGSSNTTADPAAVGEGPAQAAASKSYKEQKTEKDAAKAALIDALKVKLKAQLEQLEVRMRLLPGASNCALHLTVPTSCFL
jgi:hypothetical protein